jgi:phosphatidate cytidylyltransferase
VNDLRLPSKNFWYRTLFGSAFAIIAAVLIILSSHPCCRWLFVASVIGIHLIALYELVRLCRTKGFAPTAAILYPLSTLVLGSHALAITDASLAPLAPSLLFLGAILLPCLTRPGSIVNLALTIFSIAYLTVPFMWLLDITFLPGTSFWVAWLIIVTKGSDMAAYFGGKFFGTHALAPHLSPKKTIEGAVLGIVGSALLSLALPFIWIDAPVLPIATWLLLGALTGLTAMGGDLFESLLKRDAGVKDSNTIPGLGGVLDIIDSSLFTTPLLFIYLRATGQA